MGVRRRAAEATGLIVVGRAETVLAGLARGRLVGAPEGPVRLSYLDPPFEPGDAFPSLEPPAAARAWERMMATCLGAAARILDRRGTVCLHVDRRLAPLCRGLVRDAFGTPVVEAAWERDPGAEGDALLFAGRAATACRGEWDGRTCGFRDEGLREVAEVAAGVAPFPHPKPVRLLRRIVATTTDPGDVVLDPFLGSGTSAAAAGAVGRSWIGIDRDVATLRRYAIPR
ncbi:MAG TPA: DNA methyltransferase, partial [Actinomycetota bacterium]|nr:DNA methyltransferase [Actinomycetota bacterium]